MLQKENENGKKEESFFRAAIQKIKQVRRPEKANIKVPRDRTRLVAGTLWTCERGRGLGPSFFFE